MPFPTTTREIYDNRSLVEVICQLKFPTILEINSTDPAGFQKEVRKDYPLYQRDEQATNVPAELAELFRQLPVKIQTPPVHRFTNAAGDTVISLSSEFVAIGTRAYTRWEALKPEIDRARAGLQRHYDPPFYERIGLRYQNVIDRSALGLEDVPWRELFQPMLLGFLRDEEIGERVVSEKSQAGLLIDEVENARATIQHGILERPEAATDAYLFDVDFYIEGRMSEDDVSTILDAFHVAAGNLFRGVITNRLRTALRPVPI